MEQFFSFMKKNALMMRMLANYADQHYHIWSDTNELQFNSFQQMVKITD